MPESVTCGRCGAPGERDESKDRWIHAADGKSPATNVGGDQWITHRKGEWIPPHDVVQRTLGPDDSGCWIEGSRGWKGHGAMIGKAVALGWPIAAIDAAIVHAYDADDCDDYDGTIGGAVHELMDEAEEWLNTHRVMDGYSFGWHEGEWFLWPTETWEQTA